MRSGRQSGITIIQVLFFVALVWGGFTLYQSRPAWLSRFVDREAGARAYFNHVLSGVEKSRVQLGGTVPETQECSGLTFFQPEAGSVESCQYVAVTESYYMLTVTGQSGEVFRYQGRGSQ